MPQPVKPQTRREKARLERKRATAIAQAAQFDDELSGHELNIARLEAVPQGQRDDAWKAARQAATDAVNVLTQARDTTIGEAKALGATDADVGLDTAA